MDEFAPASSAPRLIDVRRHDERALYGHIKGSLQIRGTSNFFRDYHLEWLFVQCICCVKANVHMLSPLWKACFIAT